MSGSTTGCRLSAGEERQDFCGVYGTAALKQEAVMEMKRINSGKLRAVGYDARARILRVEFDNGSVIDYASVGDEIWRRLSGSASAWSYFRDNVEEEFTGRPAATDQQTKTNPLDELFKK
jgi:hypothetical protein